MAKHTRREALRLQIGRNRRADQYRKNTIYVYPDGDIEAQDPALAAIAERNLVYNPVLDRWMVRTIPGATVRNVSHS